MPRARRTFEEGRTYHAYNRVGGGLLPFTDDELAKTFVDLLRKVMNRDDAVVLGWCLLGNHYLCAAAHKKCYAERPVMLSWPLGGV